MLFKTWVQHSVRNSLAEWIKQLSDEVTIKRVLPFNENIIFLLGLYKDLCLAQCSIFTDYLHPVTGVTSEWDAKNTA